MGGIGREIQWRQKVGHAYKQVRQLATDFISISKEQYRRIICRIFGIFFVYFSTPYTLIL